MSRPVPQDPHALALEKLFRRSPVATLDQMQRALGTSARTVLRALARVGYLASYSHAGKHYTLRSLPQFDSRGLWFCGEVRFSSRGTLRATLTWLVCEAPAGHTHEEAQAIVCLRVHDTLRSLVEGGALGRECVGTLYLYVSPDPPTAARQIARRREQQAKPVTPPPPPGMELARTVEVLVTIIRHPGDDAGGITRRLRAHGLPIDHDEVHAVFVRYGLGKKTARSPSNASRRSGRRRPR